MSKTTKIVLTVTSTLFFSFCAYMQAFAMALDAKNPEPEPEGIIFMQVCGVLWIVSLCLIWCFRKNNV